MENKNKQKNLENGLENFLTPEDAQANEDCTGEDCVIKKDKSIVERINKKIITEDGRQLLT